MWDFSIAVVPRTHNSYGAGSNPAGRTKEYKMKLTVAFAEVPQEYEHYGEYFKGTDARGNTKDYYFKMTVQEEGNGHGQFTIDDGCNRSIPFDFTSLDELVEVLTKLKDYRDDKIRFEKHWQDQWGVSW